MLRPGGRPVEEPTRQLKWTFVARVVLTGVLLLCAVAIAVVRFGAFNDRGLVGIDYITFVAWGHRFLETGSLYLPYQLTGPFDPQPLPLVPALLPAMYPPTAAYLFAALTVVPGVLWWAMPLTVLLYALWTWRPVQWAWPILAAALCWPATSNVIIVGGTSMWIAAGVTAGLLWHWPAVAVLLKPSFAPLALIGIRHRSWWLALVIGAVASLPLAPLLGDYVRVLGNARPQLGPLFSLRDAPLALLPVVAWAARRRSE